MTDQWYYTSDGQQKGPVGIAELKHLAASGQLRPTDLVWKEGMPQWTPANYARGLFPEPAAAPYHPAAPQPESYPAGYAEPPAQPRPVRARQSRAPQRGMSTGALVALIGGIVGAVLLIVVVILVMVFTTGGQSYSVTLPPSGREVRTFEFRANSRVRIDVRSDFNTDVDLFVYDARGQLIRADTRPHRDCFVDFVAPRTERYRIELRNLDPFQSNRSHVSIN
jgi:hypothetical protein